VSAVQASALFIPELRARLNARDYKELKRDLAEVTVLDLAEGWGGFTLWEQVLLFKLLPSVRALELFEELELDQQMHLLSTLEPGAAAPALEGLDPKPAAALFNRLPERTVRRMLSLVRREKVDLIKCEVDCPPGTAGRLMHTDVLVLRPNMTIHQVMERVRASSRLHRMGRMYTLYVTDDQGRLLGAVSPRTLIAAPQDMRMSEVMSPVQLVKVRMDADQEEAAKLFSKYQLITAPVVDGENRLLGVLFVDDILHVVSQEATEDIAKMAGTEAEELETGSVFNVVRLRMPWLLASWLGGIVASLVISRFEHTLSQIVALAAFMPVISGMGGNVGTQSSTIVVRGLATGHIHMGEIGRMMWRELRIGLVLGLSYGFLLGGLAYLRFGDTLPFAFPAVVGMGIFTSMTVAAVMGALTPMVVKRLKVDPAVCSAPFVSTATDVMSLLTYFSIASWLLL
jgi:magnesium transporter